jgi:hypothetical protein
MQTQKNCRNRMIILMQVAVIRYGAGGVADEHGRDRVLIG